MSRWSDTTCIVLALAVAPLMAGADTVSDQIGLTELRARPQALRANGRSISVAQVEAQASNGGVKVDVSNPDFAGKSFRFSGIAGSPVSTHATTVAADFYGSNGVAPAVSKISLFSELTFATNNGLHTRNRALPAKLGVSVINNSWIGDALDDQQNTDILRRLDYMIDRDNVLVVNAANNGVGSSFPTLMASSYNGLTVGVPGGSSVGPARFDGGPRAKPDLVVPAASTSEAAAVASGAAALLMSEAKARRLPVSELATKAMMMAGADHLSGYERGLPGTGDDPAVPLDYKQGAGMLRVDHAFDILTSGKRPANSLVKPSGWATSSIKPRKPQTYNLTLRTAVPEFHAILDWNRGFVVASNNAMSIATRPPVLANLDLQFQMKSGKKWIPIYRSASSDDNIESIFLNDVAPGSYRLVVSTNLAEDYGLAWFSDMTRDDAASAAPLIGSASAGGHRSGAFAQVVPEPGTMTLALGASLMLLGRRRKAGLSR